MARMIYFFMIYYIVKGDYGNLEVIDTPQSGLSRDCSLPLEKITKVNSPKKDPRVATLDHVKKGYEQEDHQSSKLIR